jgi:dihydroorotase
VKLLLKNGKVVSPASGLEGKLDILIDQGKIQRIQSQLGAPGARVVDLAGLVVVPGFIDMHVHLREPGQEAKETIETGSRAAAKGGFTTVCCMPNTLPPNDTAELTRFIRSKARAAAVQVLPIAAVTKGLRGEQLTSMAKLISAGAVAFSDDGRPVSNSQVMRQALEQSRLLASLVIDHCEDKSLSDEGVMHEGPQSHLLGLRGIPAAAEEVMVARDIILAEMTGARIHIAHLSTKGSVRLLREAKKRKVLVTAEVTPHHLFLTDKACASYDTNLKVNPPLRSRQDAAALLAAVQEGLIDVFATDHAPHTAEEKGRGFDQAPFGINGLETAVSLFLDRLVNKKMLSLRQLVRMMSVRPAALLGLKDKGTLWPGADADLTLLDLKRETVVDVQSFASKSRNCPFHGWKLKGLPVATIVGGRVAYPFDGRLPGEQA